MIDKTRLSVTKVVQLFEYKKTNKDYWDRFKPYKQVVNKALPITKTLYLGYSLLFLFNNVINHFVYTLNALCTTQMNKKIARQQP